MIVVRILVEVVAVLVAIAIRYHPLFNNQTLLKTAIVLAATFGRASAIAALILAAELVFSR
jgi:hypothetical protein